MMVRRRLQDCESSWMFRARASARRANRSTATVPSRDSGRHLGRIPGEEARLPHVCASYAVSRDGDDRGAGRDVPSGKTAPLPETHTARMKRRIDSPDGRLLYGQRFGIVEPVFGSGCYNNGLDRFTLRGRP